MACTRLICSQTSSNIYGTRTIQPAIFFCEFLPHPLHSVSLCPDIVCFICRRLVRSKALRSHTSRRENLVSFSMFCCAGSEVGELKYEGQRRMQLTAGDGVFIDCRKEYSHSTGYNCAEDDDSKENLWFLQWCHFYAPCLPAVYEKYRERGGRPVFHPDDIRLFTDLLSELYDLSASSDYIRDMRINEKLVSFTYVAYGTILASGEYDGEQETGRTVGGKKLSG